MSRPRLIQSREAPAAPVAVSAWAARATASQAEPRVTAPSVASFETFPRASLPFASSAILVRNPKRSDRSSGGRRGRA